VVFSLCRNSSARCDAHRPWKCTGIPSLLLSCTHNHQEVM
jgi:hypothetical protein